jgi:SAM-dependent methyltransferase
MADGVPSVFDRALVRAHRDRAARLDLRADRPGARACEFLRNAAATELLDRLLSISRSFSTGLELGGAGAFARAWSASPEARAKLGWLATSDLSVALLGDAPGARLAADEARPPFVEASFDLVISPFALHWVDDLPGALIQIRRMLKPDGVLLAAMLGGSTLTELRQSLAAAEVETTGGAGARVSPFADVLDAAQLLQRAGFALPVADRDTLVVSYADPLALMTELRGMGETSALLDRPRRPIGRAMLARALAIYAERFSSPDGRVRATFEFLYLTGWAPHPDQPKAKRPGAASVRLADALGVKEQSAGETAAPGSGDAETSR